MTRRQFMKVGALWLPVIGIARAQTLNVSTAVNVGNLTWQAAGGSACDTARNSEAGPYDDSVYAADTAWGYATPFTASASVTICKITFQLWKSSGTLNGTLKAAIYTDVSSKPGTLVDESDTINADTVTATTAATAQTITFSSGLSAPVTASTVYRVAIIRSAGATGELGVNRVTSVGNDIDINDSGTWSDYLSGHRLLFATFSS